MIKCRNTDSLTPDILQPKISAGALAIWLDRAVKIQEKAQRLVNADTHGFRMQSWDKIRSLRIDKVGPSISFIKYSSDQGCDVIL